MPQPPPALFDIVRFELAIVKILDSLRPRPARRVSAFMQSWCACPDYFDGSRGWCKHLAALCFFLIAAAEEEPAHFLSSMGVCLMDMLNEDVIKKEEVAGDEGNPPAKRHRGPLAGLCGNHANDPVVLE